MTRPSPSRSPTSSKAGWPGCSARTPENVFYYLTIYNEPYVQPPEPENFDPEGLLRGIYRYRPAAESRTNTADILASGVAMPAALRASDMLAAEWDVAADVWSVTSWSELNRDGVAIQKERLRHPDRTRRRGLRHASPVHIDGPVHRRLGLDARGARTDPAMGARAATSRWAPTGSAFPTPGRPPADSSTPTPNPRSSRCWRRWPATADRPVGTDSGSAAIPNRRRAGCAGADLRPRTGRLSRAAFSGNIQKTGVDFRSD